MTDTSSTNSNTWSQWIRLSFASSAATTAGNDTVTLSYSTASSLSTDMVWDRWNNDWSTIRPHGTPIRANALLDTPETRAERQRAMDERRRVEEAARRELAAAEDRALALLVSVLSPEQRRDLATHGYFFVDAPVSGRRYRIDKGRSGNVKVIDRLTGTWTESLCIHQRETVPVYDTMVMQKLLIETAEDEFRAVANITRKDGGSVAGRGLLTADRLDNVIPFARRTAAEAA